MSCVEISTDYFRRIFDVAPDGMFVLDNEGRFSKVNPSFTELLGYTLQEISSKTLIDIVCGGVLPRESARAGSDAHEYMYLSRAETEAISVTLRSRSGRPVAVRLRTIAFRDEDEHIAEMVGMLSPVGALPLTADGTGGGPGDPQLWEMMQNYTTVLQSSGDAFFITAVD
ncbi:MAG: PAS domain-containing protein, partial [Deltaproteobacteria bacterium]|nr:PAS domain-containing protein [Deltaproteobacteria bacterium]